MINRHFDFYRVFVDPPSMTILVLSPKVMTTFFRAFIKDGLAEFRGLPDPSEGRYPYLNIARKFPIMPLRTYYEVLRHPAHFTAFAFVRNPYDRMLSAWKDKFHDPHACSLAGERASYPRSIRGRPLSQIRRFATEHQMQGAAEQSLVPFDAFVAFVAAQADGRRNHHWEQQSLLLQTEHFHFADTFKIETELEPGLNAVFGRMGFDHSWMKERLKTRLNASSTLPQTFHTPATRRQIADTFHRDFTTFGYTM